MKKVVLLIIVSVLIILAVSLSAFYLHWQQNQLHIVPPPISVITPLPVTNYSCTQDTDCVLFNPKTLTKCCFGYCDDKSGNDWIAVNKNWTESQTEQACDVKSISKACLPINYMCPQRMNTALPTAQCINHACQKVQVSQAVNVSPTIPENANSIFDKNCCNVNQTLKGYQCIANPGCGPGSALTEYSCLPPGYDPRKIECHTLCLSSSTNINTQNGRVNVKNLKLGMLVWTIDSAGAKELQPIIRLSSIYVGTNHKVNHLLLNDGRDLFVSSLHPTFDGRTVSQLNKSDVYDASIVKSNDLVIYTDTKTYDLLPAGDTGYYYANGILMGSTLKLQ